MTRAEWIGCVGLAVVLGLSMVGWRFAAMEARIAAAELQRLRNDAQRIAVTSSVGMVNPSGVTSHVRSALAAAGIPESAYVSVLPNEGRSGTPAGALVDLHGLRLSDLGRWLAAMRVGAADAWLVQDMQLTAGLDSGSYAVTVQLVAPGGH